MLFMGDLENGVLGKENVAGDNGNESFKDEIDVIRYALDHVDQEIFVFRPSGELVYTNQPGKDRFHLPENLAGIYAWTLDPTLTLESWNKRIQPVRECGENFESMLYLNRPGGGCDVLKMFAHSTIRVSGEELIWVFGRDVSLHVKNENRIKELNSIMNTVLDNIPVYLFVKDAGPEFRYVYWNKAFETYSHILRENALGKTDFEVFPNQKDAERFRRDDKELLRTGKDIEFLETYETKKGEIRTVKTLKTLVRNDSGEPCFLVGVSWDITDLKSTEQELVKARLKAEQSDKLKSAFLANMSHEIRTPLNAIIGFTRLVAETEDASEKDYYLNIVENNSELLTQLINDILDLSRIEAGSLEFVYKPVSIRELCLKIQEVHRVRMKEDVQLEFEDGGLNTHVLTDGNRLFQVISNLITNASKFTAKGFIRFGYQQVGDFIEFYVADSGCGIPKDKVPTIFDRFTKLNTFAQGSGLGLAICKMLVEKMGGNIFVQSEEGRGSIFKFTIPYQRITIETDINDMENNEIKENVSVGRTILVAEDVESNFLLLKAIIGKTYTLLHAWNGKEAVEIYEQSHPDLILMDIKMPEMDGLEATRIIRKVSQEIPIIALTAFAFDDDRVKALEAGCNDYLTKPLSAPLLKETIAKYLV